MHGFVAIKQVVSETIEQIKDRRENERGVIELQTGFIDLDWKTTGFHKGDFILLAGRPSMGCTSLMLQIANQVATYQQKRVLYFHLELPKEIMAKRLISQEAMVEYADLFKGKLTESEWEKVLQGAERVKHSQLIIDDTPLLSINELQEKCRKHQKEQKVELVIIDYIQLVRGIERGKKLSRKQELEVIARGIRELAIELNVPIIAISRLPRSVEWRSNHRPILRDLNENVAFVREADIVLFLYRDAYYRFNTGFKDLAEITVARNRYGECGTVELKWLSKCMKYENPQLNCKLFINKN